MLFILTGEGLKYRRQQRKIIVISNVSDGNPIKKGLLLLIAHLDMKNEAPGQNNKEEDRTKKGLHCFAKTREREEKVTRGIYHGRG